MQQELAYEILEMLETMQEAAEQLEGYCKSGEQD